VHAESLARSGEPCLGGGIWVSPIVRA
jgi:hypothetical protein